ncbi:uncharacterized protein LOC124164106 isoform X1 [Ischnura elegans]|uniref:uncharacterized protein LOC124164106 isoform X1 n=1 Tax=Ischnura elegans TaxID=197161 RepID=UPI001ED8A3CD|nr:uncharacterized protein LOC124164106 isoform X1 [Ischnura elegans]XP_046397235.1 uncharacterized protein LOC124164106 isoform X1 [Ischnura elegans]XP_046397236.1 uncharacterized protein LOC124164106 isoform X1 [Ischnura elegans]
MRKQKSFLDLSESQKYRRLKKIRLQFNSSGSTAGELDALPNHSTGDVDALPNHFDEIDVAHLHSPSEHTDILPSVTDLPSTPVVDNDQSPERDIARGTLEPQFHANESQLKNALAHWSIENNVAHSTVDKLLKILVSEGKLEGLPTTARALLCTPRSNNLKKTSCGEYLHYGLKKALGEQLQKVDSDCFSDVIEIDLNIDGLPLAKSSRSVFWAILGRIYCKKVQLSPFVIGVHHSYGKLTLTPQELLKELVEEFKMLQESGFQNDKKSFGIKIRAIICDTPARSFVTATKGHMGFNCCGKCIQKGYESNHRIILSDLNCQLRTDESFRCRADIGHHVGVSPFEEIAELGMVSQFPLDYMHLVCLGVMKKLLLLWRKGNAELKLPPRRRECLSRRLISVASWIGVEFARKTRNFDDVCRYKATEFRLFLLYVGPSLLHNYLPEKYLRHFLCLHVAISILCDEVNCIVYNEYARSLLMYFVKSFSKLYGKEALTYNVHNLIHLANDVKGLGCPLDAFSAFPFENHLGVMKRALRKQVKPLSQLHNRLHEKSMLKKPEGHPIKKYPIMLKPLNKKIAGLCAAYEKLEFNHFVLSSKSTANNCCFLRTKELVKIAVIGVKNDTPVVIGNVLEESESMPFYPLDSRSLDIHVGGKWSTEKIINVDQILSKAIRLPYSSEKVCYFPLLHTHTA